MAKRGSTKALSVEQEESIARRYGGLRSPSSGASVTDSGDVRSRPHNTLFECKYTGSPGDPLKRKPTLLSTFEKVADEAYEEGREPAVALRYYWPDSPLADYDGWVDFVVRRVDEDADRIPRPA